MSGATASMLAGLMKKGSKCPETRKDDNGNETYVTSNVHGELIVGMVFHDECAAAGCPVKK